MIETTILRSDPRTGKPIDAPQHVWPAVERADAVLKDLLKSVRSVPITATWQPEEVAPGVWSVDLHLEHEGYGFGKQLYLDQLRTPEGLKEQIGEVIWEFGRSISEQVGDQLRQIRADLKHLMTVGGE